MKLIELTIIGLLISCSHNASRSYPEVGAILQENIQNFEYCLNKFQKEAGFFNQPINLFFRINNRGKAMNISIVENTGAVEDDLLRSDRQIGSFLTLETTKCIKREITRLKFPKAKKLRPDAKSVSVSESLQFDSTL